MHYWRFSFLYYSMFSITIWSLYLWSQNLCVVNLGIKHWSQSYAGTTLTLSLLGYLKTRIRWGGYIIRKLLCSTFRICKKICKFAKIEFFIAKSSFIVKMFAKKICPKNDKLYIFEKPLTIPFQICKIFCKILNKN